MDERFALVVPEETLRGLSPDGRERLEEAIRSLEGQLESPHSKRAYREEWARWCAWLAKELGIWRGSHKVPGHLVVRDIGDGHR